MVIRSKHLYLPLLLALLLLPGGCNKQEAPKVLTEESQPYIATRDLRVRSGPGTQHEVVAQIKSGTKVNVVGREGDWLLIISKKGNPPGYIEARLARPATEEKAKPSPQRKGAHTIIADTYLRKGPGLHHPVVTKISKGTKVQVAGSEGDWLKIESKQGRAPGYIERMYAKRG